MADILVIEEEPEGLLRQETGRFGGTGRRKEAADQVDQLYASDNEDQKSTGTVGQEQSYLPVNV